VRVGRAGAGGAGADAQNPAQKEALESRFSTKEQWTELLAVVDAHLCPLMEFFSNARSSVNQKRSTH